MSLDWSIADVINWRAKKEADNGQLDTLIWATLVVDCDLRTDAMVREFAWRLRFLDQLKHFLAIRHDETQGIVRFNPSFATLIGWQGLSTNVVYLPRKKWVKKMIARLEHQADTAFERELKEST